MAGLKGLLGSKKGNITLMLIACATVLAAMGTITPLQWMIATGVHGGVYVGAQSVSDAAERFGRKAR